MAQITLRSVKGSPLTNSELDANFSNLNTELEGKLSGNQSITLSGDATGSGSTAISVTLANSGVTAGTYGSSSAIPVVTVDAKGRVTGLSTQSISVPSGSLTFTGDVTGTGTTGATTNLTLANSGVTAGTYTRVTVDAKGRVTAGSNAWEVTSTPPTSGAGFPEGYIWFVV